MTHGLDRRVFGKTYVDYVGRGNEVIAVSWLEMLPRFRTPRVVASCTSRASAEAAYRLLSGQCA